MRLVTGPAGASATRTSSRSPSGTVPSLPHAPARRVRCAFKTEEQKRRYTDIDEALPPITSPITGLPPRSKTEQLASEPIIDENEWTLSRQERTKLAVARVKARWDLLEDKRTLIGLTIGTAATVWLSGRFLDAVDRIPLIPDIFTFVGLVYSGSFFWKYVLFYDGREKFRQAISRAYHLARDVLENQDGPWGDGMAGNTATRSPTLQQVKEYAKAAAARVAENGGVATGLEGDRLQSHVTPGGAPTAPIPRTKQPGGRGEVPEGINTRHATRSPQLPSRATHPARALLPGPSAAASRPSTAAPRRGPAATRALPAGGDDQSIGATEGDAKLNEPARAETTRDFGVDSAAPTTPSLQRNTSTHPNRSAAPHRTGPGTVTDDATWLAAVPGSEDGPAADGEGGNGVDCSKQPPNTTPCPVPGSAPHQEHLVYDDSVWYVAEPAAGIVAAKEYADSTAEANKSV